MTATRVYLHSARVCRARRACDVIALQHSNGREWMTQSLRPAMDSQLDRPQLWWARCGGQVEGAPQMRVCLVTMATAELNVHGDRSAGRGTDHRARTLIHPVYWTPIASMSPLGFGHLNEGLHGTTGQASPQEVWLHTALCIRNWDCYMEKQWSICTKYNKIINENQIVNKVNKMKV